MIPMQEAKNCEDIIAQIKADLARRGYVNEHDRLGHFEAKVPLDVLLALARRSSDARFFGIQVKVPEKARAGFVWRLTKTPGQYETIVLRWPGFVVYGLPRYQSPDQSPEALHLTSFAQAEKLPRTHPGVLSGEIDLPEALVIGLGLACVGITDAKPKVAEVVGARRIDGLAASLGAYADAKETACSARKRWVFSFSDEMEGNGNTDAYRSAKHDLDAAIAKVNSTKDAALVAIREIGLEPGYLDMLLCELGTLLDAWRRSRLPQWNDSGSGCRVDLSVHALLAQRLGQTDFACTSHLVLDGAKLTHYPIVFNFTDYAIQTSIGMRRSNKPKDSSRSTIEKSYSVVPALDWGGVLSLVESKDIGWEAANIDESTVRSVFRATQLKDDDILVWHSRLNRLFYAIEARIVLVSGEQALGTVADPLTAGLGPERRRRLFEAARVRGMGADSLLDEIVDAYLASIDRQGGTPESV